MVITLAKSEIMRILTLCVLMLSIIALSGCTSSLKEVSEQNGGIQDMSFHGKRAMNLSDEERQKLIEERKRNLSNMSEDGMQNNANERPSFEAVQQRLLEACNGKKEGDGCEFTGSRGEVKGMDSPMASKKENNVLLRLENVWKIYQMGEVEVTALRGVSVEIKRGDFVAIIGASGSGKSTMMNLIGCLDIPSKGSVYLKSQDISTLSESDLASFRGKTIGFIFQQYNLIQSMSAFENVILPLEFLEYDDQEAANRAREILTFVGLGDKMHHRPTQLSGGEQQRVSIARSLACDPEIILADEPTGSLDSVTGKEILNMLYRLWKEQGKTIITVTHDLNLAKYARTTIELKDGQIMRIYENHEVTKK